MTRRPAGRRERGTQSLQAAIVLPALLLLVGLVIVCGRLAEARNGVSSAASAAARAASLERSPAAGQAAAVEAAAMTLDSLRISCPPQVTVSGDWAAPLGAESQVTATVTCQVPLDNLVPSLGGSYTVTVQKNSPIDPYRQR